MTLFYQLKQRLALTSDGRISKQELEELRLTRKDAGFLVDDLIIRAAANLDGKIGIDDIYKMRDTWISPKILSH